MEMVLNSGFSELSDEEMRIDGGKPTAKGCVDAALAGATVGAAGCIVGSFFPPGAAAYMACAVTAGVVTYVWTNV